MERGKTKDSYFDIVFKNKTNKTYFYLILIFAGYMLFMFQMNLSVIKLETNVLTGNTGGGSSNLISLPAGTSESKIIAAMLPQDNEIKRPFKWKGKQVTLTVEKPGNGFDMLVDMDRSIPLSSLTSGQKARYNSLIMKIYHPCCDAPVGACGCKHAVAIRGLIKDRLKAGWSNSQIYKESFLWLRFWWPKYYAEMGVYLVSQGKDPSKISPEVWDGKDYSTLRSRKLVAAELRRLNLK